MRHLAGLSVIGLWLVGANNASYAQDACLDARVTASDGGVFQSFGRAVAVFGDTAFIAAPWDNELGTEAGAVYVFRPNGTIWVEMQELLALDQQAGDNFGFSVAMDGNVALIGAGHVHQDGADVAYGAVYVYRYNGETWLEEEELLASDSAFQDGFSWSVSLSGEVAVIGAIGVDDNGGNSGAAYVFRFDPETQRWVEEQKLLASDGAGGDFFGRSVAVQGDMAIIGANGQDGACGGNCNAGAAYVFRYDPKTSTWIETQKLLASDAAPGDSFGDSVSLFDEILVIGAHSTGDNGSSSGSAYVFRFDPKTSAWTEEQKLLASDGAAGDQLGRSVAIDGPPGNELVVVGAFFSDAGGSSSGAAYVFRYDPEASAWIEQTQLLPNPNPSANFFGWSVALHAETAVIGAHGENQLTGAAYMFDVALNCNCPHDLDADGSVGASDLLSLLESWGPCKGCPADFDNNGAVGASDLLALLANWGPCP